MPWETPIGSVIDGMDTLLSLYSGYGDTPPEGKGPEQWKIRRFGYEYVEKNYPQMDKILKCTSTRL